MKKIIFTILAVGIGLSASADQLKDFDRIWTTAAQQIYPKEKQNLFTDEKRLELRQRAASAKTVEDLAEILNPFLLSLKVSHTYLYQVDHPDYYVMRSLFSTRDLDTPKIWHVGMQLEKINDHYVVRTVLDGYPASKAGLRRGDVLEKANGKAFHPFKSFNPKPGKVRIEFSRAGKLNSAELNPVLESPHRSFWQATQNSVRVIEKAGKKIGYIHLWSGTNDKFLVTLKKAVFQDFKNTDGLILDLRDGFGGAWWDYLDPFFPDSKLYFKPAAVTREGKGPEQAAPVKANPENYKKPMVVLINEGVRSGKEALAYQFKKTRRAQLVGAPTAGAFSMGKGVFADEKKDYLLYLAVGESLLDGNKIEGNPIQPDATSPWPLSENFSDDPQLTKALEVMSK